ncbi:phage tail protein [Photobacterium carnosum]|uniref:phage tail protein n=1 Tax=Photobacterium carnosum TaxID=2023717 RepID=UPI001E4EBCE5|nr:phage tail protein [Photobacterium carnosum]MCD9498571.1 phage tail protein [Photobacterium carnosum]
MTSLNSNMELDTRFLARLSYLPDELAKAAKQAMIKTNRWLRAASMADLGYELSIDAKAMTTRFRTYKNGGMSKLWVGVRSLGVHRLGTPVQNGKGVQVGSHFYDGAFISPMDSDQLLVFRRENKGRKSIKLVTIDISEEAEEIIDSYLPDLNRKFEEFFHREFQFILSGTQ